MSEYDPTAIEPEWQRRWAEAHAFAPAVEEGKKKFFIIFAYPGVSGYLHVGHMRGYTYADVIARHRRMTGHSVLFPAGFHGSGLPSVGLAKRVARGDADTVEYLRRNGCPEDTIPRLADPMEVVRYFSTVYTDSYWKPFGFTIDYSRLMSTVDEGYRRFIQWQFRRLNGAGLLTRKPHFAPACPSCGPVAVDASETDIAQGGGAEMLEFTVIKFRLQDGLMLPAATLRPETVFGVTNIWLNPGEEYLEVEVGGGRWLLSRPAAEKMRNQRGDGVRVIGPRHARDLMGKACTVPLTGKSVPVLPGRFVDPATATGVVMSVPGHAPFDFAALADLQRETGPMADAARALRPVTIILSGRAKNTAVEVEEETEQENGEVTEVVEEVARPGAEECPAGRLCREKSVASQDDAGALEEATKALYKDEFHGGVMGDNTPYGGTPVAQAKEKVVAALKGAGAGDSFWEFSERVVCRCGEPVIIRRIPDQWFIRYGDAGLKERTRAAAARLNLYPPEFRDELPGILDWFDDRACIRQGSWLGTEFPLKKGWIIEPISDSTLYPAYYLVSKYINDGTLKPANLDDGFFDHVFLGRGAPPSPAAEAARRDFLYWYPLDINLGGKEHKTVHFPVFLMNHVALLPPEHHPRGIFVNWWITQKGGKIAKSKGGAEPIPDAARRYGVDALRLYYCHVGSPHVDIEWEPETVLHYRRRIGQVWSMCEETAGVGKGDAALDSWLESVVNRRLDAAGGAMERLDLREAANEVFFTLYRDVRWYLKRGGANRDLLARVRLLWARLMAPFTPHAAEELWKRWGGDGFVSLAAYPAPDPAKVSREAEARENYLLAAMEDIAEIAKVTKMSPKKIVLYTAASWKGKVFGRALAIASGGHLYMSGLMKELLKDPELKRRQKDLAAFAQRVVNDVNRMGSEQRQRFVPVDEKRCLVDADGFLEREFSAEVETYSEDDETVYDPKGRMKNAVPGRPAIYMEG